MIPSLQSDHKQKEKIYRLAFAFSVIFALVFPNLNLVLAAPSQNQAKKVYPSTQAVEQVTFATRVANKLDAKKQAEQNAAKLTAIKAEQAAYRQKEEAARQAAEAKRVASEKAAAAKAAALKAAQERAAAQKAAAAKAATVQQTSYSTTSSNTTSGSSRGTFRISFYDPAALGSSLGYSGVAANYSVLPRGTRLKITMSNGQVLYRTVNDTGGFAASNPRQLDVAMPTSQIPASGILSATVEVL